MSIKNSKTAAPGLIRTGSLFLVIGIVLVAANLRAPLTSVGPLMGMIRADTGLSSMLAGLLTTLPLVAFAALSLMAPRIARRLGIENTLLACMVVLTGGILLRSTPSLGTLFAGTLVLGLAIAVCNVLLPSLIKRDFPLRIGLMTGLYSLSMNIWAALGSGLSIPLVNGLGLDWRGSLLTWAILSAIGVIALLPVLRSRSRTTAATNNVSSTVGLWKSPLAWQVTLFMGLQSISFYVTITWLPGLLYDRGVSEVSAGWLLSMSQLASLPFSFIVPVLAGRWPSQRWLAAIIAGLSFIGFTGLLIGGNTWLALWIIMIGISQGSSISLALTLFALRATNASQAAALSGMAQSIGYLLAALGPILFGFLYDLTNTWTASLLFIISTAVLLFFAGMGAGRNAQITTSVKQAA